jgi:hypothetical protein
VAADFRRPIAPKNRAQLGDLMTDRKMTSTHCQAKTAQGKPCKMAALRGQTFCFNHSPAAAAERAQARRTGGQRSHTPHAGELGSIPGNIQTIQDARQILSYTLAELLAMDNGIARARALIAIFDSFIRSIELSEIEARLQALEQQSKAR